MSRRVVHFSCGTASAVAAKLTVAKHPYCAVVNAFIAEEHADNRRFLADVERWIGKSITVLRDEKYSASCREVVRREHYTRGAFGAPCSRALKRKVLEAWCRPDDIPVLGYTVDEQDRIDRFLAANNGNAEFPLDEAGLTKSDCLALVQRAGIELPLMSRMGYAHDNCIGCWKGGMGYWNKIRRDFPADFDECAQIEEAIGPSAYLFFDRKTGKRFSLRQLPPAAGRHDEPEIECGFACLMAEQVML